MSISLIEDTLLEFIIDKPKKSSSKEGDEITLKFTGSDAVKVKVPIFGIQEVTISCVGNMKLTQLKEENDWCVSGSIDVYIKDGVFTKSESGSIPHTIRVEIQNAENATAAELILAVFKNITQSPIFFTSDGTKLELTSKSSHKSYINSNGVLVLAVYIEKPTSTN